MDQQNSHGKLDMKISATLKRLDQLLALLDGYKPVLEHNANSAAVEIRANFDGLMDALYQRQLHLLQHLDKVYKEKIALIDNSKQTIEALHAGILSCVSTRHASDSRIHDYISRSESVLLNSSSAPFVSFRADRSTLHQAIANYGRVVSRYSGHFADPSQPSACLPLAVEEEDNHEESHEHTAIFTHVSCPCSCVKPHWRQWLFDTAHECSPTESLKVETQKLTSPMVSSPNPLKDVLVLDSHTPAGNSCSLHSSTDIPKKGTDIMAPFPDISWTNRFVTSKRHLMLHDFIRSSAPSFRRQSQTEESDLTGTSASDSFTILTGSANGRMDDLRDWLFCDTAELYGMPGLSTVLPPSMRQKRFSVMEESTTGVASHCSSQLPPSTGVSSTAAQFSTNTTASTPLLPAHLLSSGPLDLSLWLRPQSEPESAGMEVESNQISQEKRDPPLEKPVNSTEAPAIKGCPYVQCIGGPGGPTCCGARMQCLSVLDDATVESSATAVVNNAESSDAPPHSSSGTPGNTIHPVVAQLNQIASSHWSNWVEHKTADRDSTVASSMPDIQSWLQPGAPNSFTPSLPENETEDLAASEDPVLPPKRRTTEKGDFPTAKESTVVVQSPFICLSDPVENKTATLHSPRTCPRVLRKSASANSNQIPMQMKHESKDDYEEWLLHKLSNLSTTSEAFPIGVDKWLTEHTSTPTVPETRLKLE